MSVPTFVIFHISILNATAENLHMIPMRHGFAGGHLQGDVFQDHPLGPDLDLLMVDTADDINAR